MNLMKLLLQQAELSCEFRLQTVFPGSKMIWITLIINHYSILPITDGVIFRKVLIALGLNCPEQSYGIRLGDRIRGNSHELSYLLDEGDADKIQRILMKAGHDIIRDGDPFMKYKIESSKDIYEMLKHACFLIEQNQTYGTNYKN